MRTRSLSGLLRDLSAEGYVTPASIPGGEPPPSKRVAPLEDLLSELEADRGERCEVRVGTYDRRLAGSARAIGLDVIDI